MKVAIITGGSRGIGKSAARECGARGTGVILTYNSHKAGADEIVQEIEAAGGKAVMLALDVGDTSRFPGFAAEVTRVLRDKFERTSFDYLVNNAGFGMFTPITEISEPVFDSLFNVHLKGPFFLTQALLPLMVNGGAILNVTSASTRVATVGVAPYAAFKGGLEVLTRYMAKEFGDRRIRANAISPGPIRTDLADRALEKYPEFAELLTSQTALGRLGEPGDVGKMIASLLSDDHAWVNAQTIEVGGGYMI